MRLPMPRSRFLVFLFVLPALAAIALGADAAYLFTHPAVIVEWSTASELDTVGFNIYRSENPQGDFQLINDKLIPSSSDALAGGNYSYRDTTVKAGRTYYYMLEDVTAAGATDRNGPIEVKAEVGGIPEMGVTAVFLIIAGVSLYLLLHGRRENIADVIANP